MDQSITLPQPLFFKRAQGETVVFINAAHVVKIELDAVSMKSGKLHLDDGSTVEIGANETDWILHLMAAHSHEQNRILGEMKKLTGDEKRDWKMY